MKPTMRSVHFVLLEMTVLGHAGQIGGNPMVNIFHKY